MKYFSQYRASQETDQTPVAEGISDDNTTSEQVIVERDIERGPGMKYHPGKAPIVTGAHSVVLGNKVIHSGLTHKQAWDKAISLNNKLNRDTADILHDVVKESHNMEEGFVVRDPKGKVVHVASAESAAKKKAADLEKSTGKKHSVSYKRSEVMEQGVAEGLSEMDNRTPSGDRREQRANSPEAKAQREKEQQEKLKKVSPEMRKKLGLPEPKEQGVAEATENLPGQRTHILNKDVRHPEHGILTKGTVLRHTSGDQYEVRAGRARGKIVGLDKQYVNKMSMEEVESIDEALTKLEPGRYGGMNVVHKATGKVIGGVAGPRGPNDIYIGIHGSGQSPDQQKEFKSQSAAHEWVRDRQAKLHKGTRQLIRATKPTNEEVELDEAKATRCGRCGTTHVPPSQGGMCPALNKEETQMNPMDKYLAAIEGRADFTTSLDEKTLSSAEMKKREEVAKAIERENPSMPMGKKMAIATATAKKVAEEQEDVAEAKAHTVPKTEKEKDLAALAEPKDKITHADVMVGRGVTKEESEIDESTPTKKQVKQGIGIARDKRYAGGNMTGATKAMDKINKGIAMHPAVAKELQKQNEEVDLNEEELPVGIKIHHTNKAGKTQETTLFTARDAAAHEKQVKKEGGKVTHRQLVYSSGMGEKKPVNEAAEVQEAMISYSDFQDKLAAHRKAGNKVVDDKYSSKSKKASYTTIDKEGMARKVTHTDAGTKQETLGKMSGDDDEADVTANQPEKRGRGRPAGSKSGARRHS